VRAAVLAGGAARRYGGHPKGLVELGGRRILDRVVDALAAVTGEPPLLVANAPDGPTWRPDLRTVPDARPGYGSLGGIYTAVVAGPGPVLCVAWDMPFVTPALLRALVAESAGRDAFLPESDGRRGVEPLCAVYGPACGPAIERQFSRTRSSGSVPTLTSGWKPMARRYTTARAGAGVRRPGGAVLQRKHPG